MQSYIKFRCRIPLHYVFLFLSADIQAHVVFMGIMETEYLKWYAVTECQHY